MRQRIAMLALVGILCIASAIRLYKALEYFPFWPEQVDDILLTKRTWADIRAGDFTHLFRKGQAGTYRWSLLGKTDENPIYSSVAYYYIYLPIAILSAFYPYGFVLFLIGIGIATVYMLYLVGMELFESSTVGLLAAALGTVSYWLSVYSRWIWNTSMMPFLTLVSLYAYIQVTKKRMRWWYVFVFVTSLESQIHPTGYVLFAFLFITALYFRPAIQKGIWSVAGTFVAWFIPLFSTLYYEITSGFPMVRAMGGIVTHSVVSGSSFINEVGLIFVNAFGFTTVDTFTFFAFKQYIRHYSLYVGPVLFVIVSLFLLRWWVVRTHIGLPISKLRRWILSWGWIVCVSLPPMISYVYADQKLNDYSRMNSVVFVFPLLLLYSAFGISRIWKTGNTFFRVVVFFIVGLYAMVNLANSADFLWRYNQNSFAPDEFIRLGRIIPEIAAGANYELTVYRLSDGVYRSIREYQSLFFTQYFGLPMPERFNGVPYWAIPVIPLSDRTASVEIIVIDRHFLDHIPMPEGAEFVYETRAYHIYRVLKHI